MGKRKSKTVVTKKRLPKLLNRFNCLQCHHESCVECKMSVVILFPLLFPLLFLRSFDRFFPFPFLTPRRRRSAKERLATLSCSVCKFHQRFPSNSLMISSSSFFFFFFFDHGQGLKEKDDNDDNVVDGKVWTSPSTSFTSGSTAMSVRTGPMRNTNAILSPTAMKKKRKTKTISSPLITLIATTLPISRVFTTKRPALRLWQGSQPTIGLEERKRMISKTKTKKNPMKTLMMNDQRHSFLPFLPSFPSFLFSSDL